MVILIYVCIKSNLLTLELLLYFVSIDAGAQVVIFTHVCISYPHVDPVWSL